jgi:hypothetical protein
LHDIAFEDLERDQLGQIRGCYEALELPDFEHVKGPLTAYVNSIAAYKKNVLTELPLGVRQHVHNACRQSFEEWGYAA